MACIYQFRNKQFNSELELDNFLLDRYKYIKDYPDLVFSNFTPQQIEVKKKLDDLKQESQEHWNKYLQWRREHSYKFTDDGEYEIIKEPYKGVTGYLSDKEIGGKHIHPKFIRENYWKEKFILWKVGKFGKVEQELKGYNENDTPLTEQQCLDLQKDIELRWKNQAEIGTAIHNVLQLYFTRVSNPNNPNEEIYVFELDNPKDYIINHLEASNVPYLNMNDGKPIDDAIQQAKAIHEDLKNKLGQDLLFFPEYLVYQEVYDDKVEKVLGKSDLVIIDGRGKTHILDYKTSIKHFNEYGDTKQLTYKYQLATYQRMLETHGFDTYRGRLLLAPIKIEGFRKEGDSYVYDGVASSNFITRDISADQMEKIYQNIDTFLPVNAEINLTTQDVMLEHAQLLKTHFADKPGEREITEESIKEYLTKINALKRDNSGNFVYKVNGKTIIEKDEVEFIRKVTEFRKTLPSTRIRVTGQLKNQLAEALEKEDPNVLHITSYTPKEGEDVSWLKSTIKPYCNGEWEIYDNEELEKAFGIIFLQNKRTKTIDVIKVSTSFLRGNFRNQLKKDNPQHDRLGLTGAWETDAQANSKSNSLMMEAANGNIELMETMAVLNCTDGFGEYKIGKMMVVNPYDNEKIEPSNEELLYCFDQLNKFSPMKWNKFESKEIEFVNSFERVARLFSEIITANSKDTNSDNFFNVTFKGCTSVLDEVADDEHSVQDKIKALSKLLKLLDESDAGKQGLFDTVYRQQGQLQDDRVRLYNEITLAIAKLKGLKFRQQLSDHGKWFQSILILSKGLSGSYIDNPGNLSSETLNTITSLVKEAYQNTRDEVLRKKSEIDKLVEAVKNEANFGYFQENIGFNQTTLYKDLFDQDAEEKGDLMFVRLDKVAGAKRDFLEYILKEINNDRFGEVEAKRLLDNDSDEYYQVPLARGSIDSTASARGMLASLKESLKSLNPHIFVKKAEEKIEGIREELQEADNKEDPKTFIFKMTNMFDSGNPRITSQEKRLQRISEIGIQNLERNVETIVLKHIFAYSQQRNIDTVFPLIKASAIHLQYQGANQNKYFDKDLSYHKDYIWNKVLNRSLIPPELRKLDDYLKYLKAGASKFTLAFSPVQSVYQSIQGLWQNISLIIRKPDGTNAFTFANFAKAYRIVSKDFFDISGKPTLCSRLNELFALNDMDMNTYIDRISKNRKGIYNFDNLLYKFASRPDYYNRMTIFLCQMMEDGSLDAYSLDSEGNLVYDWTKDKRFAKFASDPKSNSLDPEFQRQKSLYYTIATQFVNEHTKNKDGSDFILNMNDPKPLPRAYTSKQVESMKNLADNIYGYYSHENKSLMMSQMIGSMWLQFKTYWSAKKNQYLQSGGIKTQGSWKEVVEKTKDGKDVRWYYKVDKMGQVMYDQPPIPDIKPNEQYKGPLADTKEKQLAPVIQWQGNWQEGILVSASKVFKDRHIINNWRELKSEEQDPMLKAVFESNMKQLGYDLFMFWIIGGILGAWLGDLLDELYKDNKKSHDFADGLRVSAAKIAAMSVKNSFTDLNFIGSIGNPIGQWTPFAFTWWGNSIKRFYNAAIGEDDWYDTIVKSTSVTNQFKPLFDTLKPDSFRTKAEGGTWEKASTIRKRERRENN